MKVGVQGQSGRARSAALRTALGVALLAAGLWTASPLLPAHAATVNVSVGNHFFEDNVAPAGEITATAGDTIRFTIANGTHDLHIDELGVHTQALKSGQSANLIVNQPGTYELYCDQNHGSNTHRTTLRITAAPSSPTTAGGGGGGSGAATSTPTTASGGNDGGGGGSGGNTGTGQTGGSTGSGTSGGSTSGGGGAGTATGSTGSRTGTATASTNAAGQLVTAEGEVIATADDERGGAGDAGGDDGDDGGAEGGQAGAVTLELFAADGTRIKPTSSSSNSNLVGLLGVLLLMAGAVVIFRKPRKRDDHEPDEDDADTDDPAIIYTDAPLAEGGDAALYDPSDYDEDGYDEDGYAEDGYADETAAHSLDLDDAGAETAAHSLDLDDAGAETVDDHAGDGVAMEAVEAGDGDGGPGEVDPDVSTTEGEPRA